MSLITSNSTGRRAASANVGAISSGSHSRPHARSVRRGLLLTKRFSTLLAAPRGGTLLTSAATRVKAA